MTYFLLIISDQVKVKPIKKHGFVFTYRVEVHRLLLGQTQGRGPSEIFLIFFNVGWTHRPTLYSEGPVYEQCLILRALFKKH